ncbi:ImuA family protein [Mucilaginibacter agri]|uniref:Error-prone repair protein ImuA n=1 Tax=Mucilaginibacter agri TaxID=2695265 RepID=A0A966DW99_9SPHI|nr:Error-prone repair protein ImuA [Mucilaginibacter agri]NCD71229.1 Error-prone repair protein ImuA [Mucilaginibacter agri]
MVDTQKKLISQLQKDILRWQGFTAPSGSSHDHIGLGEIEVAFPNGVFPKGTIHEFLTFEPEHTAAGSGFIGGLLKVLMGEGSACLWIGVARKLFPIAFGSFGIEPDRIIFLDLKNEKEVLWATEEALKCEGLAAVVAELREISFTQSRRLQLAVEKSKVTGFILRTDPLKLSTTACAARWQITPLSSLLEGAMPGVGFPRWNVELLKVRNGNPGSWTVEWNAGQFVIVAEERAVAELSHQTLKAG